MKESHILNLRLDGQPEQYPKLQKWLISLDAWDHSTDAPVSALPPTPPGKFGYILHTALPVEEIRAGAPPLLPTDSVVVVPIEEIPHS